MKLLSTTKNEPCTVNMEKSQGREKGDDGYTAAHVGIDKPHKVVVRHLSGVRRVKIVKEDHNNKEAL